MLLIVLKLAAVVTTLVIGYLGFHASLRPIGTEKQIWFRLAFIVLSVVFLIDAYTIEAMSDKTNDARLHDQTSEITRSVARLVGPLAEPSNPFVPYSDEKLAAAAHDWARQLRKAQLEYEVRRRSIEATWNPFRDRSESEQAKHDDALSRIDSAYQNLFRHRLQKRAVFLRDEMQRRMPAFQVEEGRDEQAAAILAFSGIVTNGVEEAFHALFETIYVPTRPTALEPSPVAYAANYLDNLANALSKRTAVVLPTWAPISRNLFRRWSVSGAPSLVSAADNAGPAIGSEITAPFTNTSGKSITLHLGKRDLIIRKGQRATLSGRVRQYHGLKVVVIPGDCDGASGDGNCYFPMTPATR